MMKLRGSIRLQNICKTYKGRNFAVEALKNINLEICPGSYCSIIGKSGSGKSSLLKIVGLMDFDYDGVYVFYDHEVSRHKDAIVSKYRKKIGFVFQDFQLIHRHTVQRNLETASVIKLGYVDKARIQEVLEQVGMASKAESYPDELSGGQKQRVSIARAMLAKPELLIADEPTGAIDEENTENILSLIDKLHQETETTILVVTHDMDVAQRADRVIELRDGVILNDGIFFEKRHFNPEIQ